MSRPSARAVAPLLVLALVVLAGCNGVFGSGESDVEPETEGGLTAAPVPNETAVETDALDPSLLPPGVEPDRVTSESALRRAHVAIVSDSVTVRTSYEGNATEAIEETTYVRNRSTYLQTVGERGLRVRYADPTGRYTREPARVNGSWVLRGDAVVVSDPRQDAPLSLGVDAISSGPADVTTVQREGTTYVRIHSVRNGSDGDEQVATISQTAYVRPDGFVRTVVQTFEVRLDDRSGRIERRVSYRNVGNTTVPEPDWVLAKKASLGLDDEPPPTPAEGGPPGIGEQRLYDADALWEAHRSVLRNRSFAFVRRSNWSDVDGVVESRTVVENETTYADSVDGRVYRYVDPTGTYRRQLAGDGGDGYEISVSGAEPFRLHPDFYGATYLVENGSSVARLERDGTTYFRIDIPGPPPGHNTAAENHSATALVRESGLIERISIDVALQRREPGDDGAVESGEWVTVSHDYAFTDVGNATVDEPAWVTRVKRNRSSDGPTGPPTPTEPSTPTEPPTPTDELDEGSASTARFPSVPDDAGATSHRSSTPVPAGR